MEKAFEFASSKFRPLYYTMQYAEDHSKIEMSFDLTHYQPQFCEKLTGSISAGELLPSLLRGGHEDSIGEVEEMASGSGKHVARVPEPPLHKHVFQTIFLDRDGSQELWTWKEIAEEKRIHEKWWKQQSHRWQHYAAVVPWMMFINGKHNTQ